MEQHIRGFLAHEYGVNAHGIHRMTTGVGGDTFRVDSAQG